MTGAAPHKGKPNKSKEDRMALIDQRRDELLSQAIERTRTNDAYPEDASLILDELERVGHPIRTLTGHTEMRKFRDTQTVCSCGENEYCGAENCQGYAAPVDQRVVFIARCPEHGLHGQRNECFVCGGPVEQVPFAPSPTTEADSTGPLTPEEEQ